MFAQIDLTNPAELERIFPLMHQLRPHLNLTTFTQLVEQVVREGYELWQYAEDSRTLGLVSLRPYTDFPRGTHMFIDDLVVDQTARSQGVGAKLLKFAEEESRRRQLPSMRLNCAQENERGFKFYTRESWRVRGHAFVKNVETTT